MDNIFQSIGALTIAAVLFLVGYIKGLTDGLRYKVKKSNQAAKKGDK